MEDGAADASAGGCGEGGFGGGRATGCRGVADEADAAQERALCVSEGLLEVEAERGEGGEGVRREAFAAGLVDGGLHAVDDFDLKALRCGGDGARQTGGACADYDYVCVRCGHAGAPA